MTPIREALLALVSARLAAEIPDVPVERARRADPPLSEFPLLIVRGGDLTPDDAQGAGETTYTAEVLVTGFAKAPVDAADADLAAEQAMSALHARVVAALAAWQPDGVDLSEVRESGATEFLPYDLDESAAAAGEFTARFDAISIRPTGHPYAA